MNASEKSPYPAQRAYSRTERLSDAAVHISGVAAAAVAVPTLIALAAIWNGSGPIVAGVSVYGATRSTASQKARPLRRRPDPASPDASTGR